MSVTAAKSCGSPAVYHRRQPERAVLYRVVQVHLATWLALHDDDFGGQAPALTEREFRRYLECGILAHDFGALHNAHLHFHVLMIDGMFCEEEAGHLHFQETCLTAEKMAHLHERSANASSAFSCGADCWTRPKAKP